MHPPPPADRHDLFKKKEGKRTGREGTKKCPIKITEQSHQSRVKCYQHHHHQHETCLVGSIAKGEMEGTMFDAIWSGA